MKRESEIKRGMSNWQKEKLHRKLIINTKLSFNDNEYVLIFGMGNFYTYHRLCKENPNTHFFCLEDDDISYMLRKDKNIYYTNSDKVEYILETLIRILTENKIMKFDKIIMNPPYDGDGNKPALSAQIMYLAYKCTNELISICPPTMVTYNKGDKYKEFIDEMNYHCVDCHPVDSSLFSNITINRIYLFHFKKNVHSDIDLNDIKWTLYSNPEIVKNINNKIRQYINLTGNNLFKTEIKPSNKHFVVNKDKYYVYTTKIRGHMKDNIPSWDWTTLLSPDFKIEKGIVSDHTFACWAFDSEEEAKSFVDWINTDEFMFSLFLVKEGMTNNHNIYEFLPNISSPQLDWKLTDEECLYIKDFMKPFGWKSQNVNI